MENFKVCTMCGKEKPSTTEYFGIEKRNKNGLQARCRECQHKLTDEYRKAHPKQFKLYKKKSDAKYRKTHHEEKLEYDKKYYVEHKKECNERDKKYQNAHKEILSEKKKIYRAVNKETIKAQRKLSYEKNIEKVLLRSAINRHYRLTNDIPTLTMEQWAKCKKYFDNKCAYCGCKVKLLEKDHFIPLSKGGHLNIQNVIPACTHCNRSKWNNDYFTWYPKQPFYSEERNNKILKYLGFDKNNNQQLALTI
jgi:5-methylcytosine-specific restriction endonuclease McrA